MDFCSLLNDRQLEAVRHTEGPLLIIAGAGSGKTRVLTFRAAYLIDEMNVNPWNIMALTFTNKAAQEMRTRINDLVSFGAESVWVSTFHSACARILRRFIDRLGYTTGFSIYDTDDSSKLIKDLLSELRLDAKRYHPKKMARHISYAKNHMISVADSQKDAVNKDDEAFYKIYSAYEKTMFRNNALDFDDLLIKTVTLFSTNPDVLENYRNRLRYLMVDEYQDTNKLQFEFIELLSSKYRNICVVGDDDQSIYKFRGADIGNILSFDKIFPEAKVVKLEQNYRSTKNIINAANGVIRNNSQRRDKTLWTDREEGDLIEVRQYDTASEEALDVIHDINLRSKGGSFNSFAVLYRTNAQSRLFEEALVRRNIPYRIIGGINFYSRKEVKDILAYLKTIENPRDELSVKRIINLPRRGLGIKTIERIDSFAKENNIPFFEAASRSREIVSLGRTADSVFAFSLFIRKFQAFSKEISVSDLIKKLIDETEYIKALKDDGSEESLERISNVEELISKAEIFVENSANKSLSAFLQEVSLVADIDSFDPDADCVQLMTVHSSKGLEFDNVYLVGIEEGLFPGFSALFSENKNEIEEERRLFYVGMTRARNTLKITSAKQRFMNGEIQFHELSGFAKELPVERISDKRRNIRSGVNYENVSTTAYVKKNPEKTLSYLKNLKIEKVAQLGYKNGDFVYHVKFGKGTVLEIKDGSRDYEVTVDFDKYGVKRMFASFAKLKKISN